MMSWSVCGRLLLFRFEAKSAWKKRTAMRFPFHLGSARNLREQALGKIVLSFVTCSCGATENRRRWKFHWSKQSRFSRADSQGQYRFPEVFGNILSQITTEKMLEEKTSNDKNGYNAPSRNRADIGEHRKSGAFVKSDGKRMPTTFAHHFQNASGGRECLSLHCTVRSASQKRALPVETASHLILQPFPFSPPIRRQGQCRTRISHQRFCSRRRKIPTGRCTVFRIPDMRFRRPCVRGHCRHKHT